ncbi:IclR family transcriptional regulator [Cupriavidus gilardii CR3]|uniref:Helix-turn-helix domain-containing protein n=1 Tax=Cupriavidus gilardii TaxID=82541 RepID=A0A849B5B3_9BURK|nr:IclR family transcriptional regulator C-terminal domain-containing protein [Cupriavidus gilardii]ALD93093.1 IclR family transcriptional regulator [Cupriavidus gilardii CR3]KAB0599493.1 helix-turn-helix domain-containing protein [Cupriavidus gilardii]MCT9013000.1 helix-turn-helix domain-containing protein [Cupriavidus gilardii]MCT9052554.1 helix-turn-helix domain-containing protein [Cupriavidus gilardii]NNH10751.1 helix-turn-helix domain-containing protein [Cupriavidus gilardii]
MTSRLANQNVRQADVSTTAPEEGARALRRGLTLLDAILAGGRDGLRVVDLCRAAGLERPTVYRLLATLIECGYVAQRGRFRYVSGPRLAAMPQRDGSTELAEKLRPVLARVSGACGDAAFAIVRDGSLSRCIARHVGTHPVQVLVIQVGTRQPLGVGAAGLALLSALPDEAVGEIIEGNADTLAQYGGMTPERMRILIRATRERGWSVIGNHATRGALAVGMAVHNRDGEPVAGISVASTLARMPRDRQQLIARLMREAVGALLPKGL